MAAAATTAASAASVRLLGLHDLGLGLLDERRLLLELFLQFGDGELGEHLVLLHPAADVDVPVVRRPVLLVRVLRERVHVAGELGVQGRLLERLHGAGLLDDALHGRISGFTTDDRLSRRRRGTGRSAGLRLHPTAGSRLENDHQNGQRVSRRMWQSPGRVRGPHPDPSRKGRGNQAVHDERGSSSECDFGT